MKYYTFANSFLSSVVDAAVFLGQTSASSFDDIGGSSAGKFWSILMYFAWVLGAVYIFLGIKNLNREDDGKMKIFQGCLFAGAGTFVNFIFG